MIVWCAIGPWKNIVNWPVSFWLLFFWICLAPALSLSICSSISLSLDRIAIVLSFLNALCCSNGFQISECCNMRAFAFAHVFRLHYSPIICIYFVVFLYHSLRLSVCAFFCIYFFGAVTVQQQHHHHHQHELCACDVKMKRSALKKSKENAFGCICLEFRALNLFNDCVLHVFFGTNSKKSATTMKQCSRAQQTNEMVQKIFGHIILLLALTRAFSLALWFFVGFQRLHSLRYFSFDLTLTFHYYWNIDAGANSSVNAKTMQQPIHSVFFNTCNWLR